MLIRTMLVCTALLLCWSAALAAVPQEIAGCKVLKVWHFDNDPEGWQPDHNVGPFAVSNGILSFENTGPDPWITLRDAGGFDSSSYSFIGIKMRSTATGVNEVYFGSDKHGGPAAGMMVGNPIAAGRDFRFYEYDMSRVPLWDGKITLLRIDPANGGAEVGAKIDIDWIAVYQPIKPTLRVGRPYAGRDSNGTFVTVPVTNVRGPKSKDAVSVSVGLESQQIGCPRPHETATATLRLRKPQRQAHVRVAVEAETACEALVALPSPLHDKPAPPLTRIAFNSNREMSEATLLWPDGGIAGVFRPLAALAYVDAKGIQHYIEPCPNIESSDNETVELGATENVEGGSATFTWMFQDGSVDCDMRSTVPLKVLRFEGPRLLAGEGSFGSSKTHGLFPGLEYLDKNEPSSAVRHVGPKFADRHVPDPYKVTVPVMAVETEKGVVGISWHPMGKWAEDQRASCAEFESPNRSEGAANHLMTLFAPSVPDFVEENADFAAVPFLLKSGFSIRVGEEFFARPGEKITDVIPDYYAAHGTPDPPPVAHGVDGTIDVCMKAYTESLYFPDKNAWKNHFGLHQTPWFNNAYAAMILAESLRTNDPGIARKVKIDPATQISSYTGSTLGWFSDAERARIDCLVSLLQPDGSYPYEITEDVGKKVKDVAATSLSKETALGDAGEKNSGLTLRILNPILEAAARTGDKKYIEAGLRGLGYLNSCSVPRGSQTWEVHAHAPDILAAAHAVDANVLGYEITGQVKYLDYARFWAYTGLPFVYALPQPIDPTPVAVQHFDQGGEGKSLTWSKPSEFYEDTRRHISPGATIPVFGTTVYVIPWFGRPVQWCGLDWANAVKSYTRRRPDGLLEEMAYAVFASGTQQQFDKGWAAGTYPDAWGLRENTPCAAFIAPDSILDYAYSLRGEKQPSVVDSEGFDIDGQHSVLSTFARIEKCETQGRTLMASLKYYPNQDFYTSIARVGKPSSVHVDGRPLAEADDLSKSGPAYHYDPAGNALHIKCRPESRNTSLSVTW